jgi:hypothetical protein
LGGSEAAVKTRRSEHAAGESDRKQDKDDDDDDPDDGHGKASF